MEHHDVRRYFILGQSYSFDASQPLCQAPGIGVVFSQAIYHCFQCHNAGSCDNPRLPHAAAQHLAKLAGSLNKILAPAQQ